MTRKYGDGSNSSVGTQLRTDYYDKKALIDIVKEQYFGPLADATAMPKNMGKEIVKYHYIPLLDDRNINDQGIDANGVSVANEVTITIISPDSEEFYAVGNGIDAAAALAAAQLAAVDVFKEQDIFTTDYSTSKAAAEGDGWTITEGTAVEGAGNLYGSSKDIGKMTARMPVLTEHGGKVNRVGYTRITLTGTINKFGFYDEYTQESMDFDSDAQLEMHVRRESLRGANEITEDLLMIDLLNSAGVVRYPGAASSTSTITAEGAEGINSILTYEVLMRLGIDLDNNRCPKDIKLIKGSLLTDTRTIDSARVLHIGSELIPTFKRMKDLHGDKAFIDQRHYAAAGNTMRGEIGSVDAFRIVVVPEMGNWSGAGAAVTTNPGYRETGGNYDVFPALCIGKGSFTTVGFQSDGKTFKFKIKHAKPGSTESYANDPYGETGFNSIKWYYGFMVLRPEWLAVIKTVAEI